MPNIAKDLNVKNNPPLTRLFFIRISGVNLYTSIHMPQCSTCMNKRINIAIEVGIVY